MAGCSWAGRAAGRQAAGAGGMGPHAAPARVLARMDGAGGWRLHARIELYISLYRYLRPLLLGGAAGLLLHAMMATAVAGAAVAACPFCC